MRNKDVACGRQQAARDQQTSHKEGQVFRAKKRWAELRELPEMKVVMLFNRGLLTCWFWFLPCLLGLLYLPLLAALVGQNLVWGEKCPQEMSNSVLVYTDTFVSVFKDIQTHF